MGFAGDEGNFLRAEEEADGGKRGGTMGEEGVVIASAATEAMALVVEGHAGDEDAVEFRDGDARAAKRFGFPQAERVGDNDVVPRFDFVPVELGRRFGVLDHEGEDDAFFLSPGFLDKGMDVGLRREWCEEGDAFAFEEGGQVCGKFADDERGLGVSGGSDGEQAGADVAAEGFLGGHGRRVKGKRQASENEEVRKEF